VAGSFIQLKAPKWVCSVICANLDVDDIDNVSVSKTTSIPTVPLDPSFTGISPEELINLNKNNAVIDQVRLSKATPGCLETVTDADECLKHGTDLASWFMYRLLNPGAICNYDTGDCGLLK